MSRRIRREREATREDLRRRIEEALANGIHLVLDRDDMVSLVSQIETVRYMPNGVKHQCNADLTM
jgi:hypothetical protein